MRSRARPARRVESVHGLGDDLETGLALEQTAQTVPENRVIVGDGDTDVAGAQAWDGDGTVSSMRAPDSRA